MAFATDDFTGLTAGTDLNGRTASGGGTWTADAGVLKGSAGGDSVTNTLTTGRGIALHSIAPTGTDYSVTATISQANTNRNSLGLIVRGYDTSNHIFAYFVASSTWQIVRRSSALGDTRIDADGSATNPPSTARTVVLTVSGVSPNILLSLKSDGVTVATATLNNSAYDAKGQVGIKYNFTDLADFDVLDGWSASDTLYGPTNLMGQACL